MSKLIPVNGRIIVEPTVETATPSGILIPDKYRTIEKPEVGIIIDVDTTEEHKLNDQLKPGVKILFNKFAATLIERKSEGKKYLLMIKDSILGIYKEE